MTQTRLSPINENGMVVAGTRGTHSKKRDQRLARRVTQVFALREQGRSMRDIATTLKMTLPSVEAILHDQEYIRRRLTSYNEQLRSATPKAIKVVHEVLDSTDPRMLGQRADMARWVLEATKTVGKESPINVFVRGGDTNITVTNDTLQAARALAAQMRAALPAAPVEGEVIDAEVIARGASEDSGGTKEVGLDSQQPGSCANPDVVIP